LELDYNPDRKGRSSRAGRPGIFCARCRVRGLRRPIAGNPLSDHPGFD
jgi:hypothetical protein